MEEISYIDQWLIFLARSLLSSVFSNSLSTFAENQLKMRLKNLAAPLAIAISLASTSAAQATNMSFTGNFTYDNDVQKFTFVVAADSNVTLRSWSYAGGVNAAGDLIARGGFDPILSLFDSSGIKIVEQDDAGCGLVAPDAVTGKCYDVNKNILLAAGDYTVSIQQYDNFTLGSLAAGYARDGDANRHFRNDFYDVANNKRDSHWAFDILNVDIAAQVPPTSNVPEPASLAILGLGIVGMGAARRRRK